MRVSNFKCTTCKSQEVCKGFATLKKFDEEYSRNPLPVDITMDDCDLYTLDDSYDSDVDNSGSSSEAEDIDV